jgi:chromosomal replication initiation ATPase DnaA
MSQLTFDLPRFASLERADFLVSNSNSAAVEWIDRWPLWPSTALVVHGPSGSGKTHLAHLWRERASALVLAGETLTETVLPNLVAACPPRFALDNADLAAERMLLHPYNSCLERRGSLFLTACSEPGSWRVTLADLRSRLRASVVVGIGVPDDALLSAILVKHFADRQVRVSRAVIAYLIRRMERSFAAARSLAAHLDAAALRGGTAVTIPLARKIVAQLGDHSSSSASESGVT